MTEVTPLLKEKVECPCAQTCGKYGTPRKKQAKDGLRHVHGCPCKRCTAPRYKQRSTRREKGIARAIGGERSWGSGVVSGADVTGVVDIEETAGEAYVRGLRRWWHSAGIEKKMARLRARNNGIPKAFVASWDGKPRVVVQDWADWCQSLHIVPAALARALDVLTTRHRDEFTELVAAEVEKEEAS